MAAEGLSVEVSVLVFGLVPCISGAYTVFRAKKDVSDSSGEEAPAVGVAAQKALKTNALRTSLEISLDFTRVSFL